MNSLLQRGFTLIEVIIFIVVVGAGLAGILSVSTNIVRSSADPMLRKQAVTLADSILEEVLLQAYCDPGGPSGSTRQDMNDVSDFDGKTNSLFSIGAMAIPAPLLAKYTIGISVASDTTTLENSPNIPAKRVTVTITGGNETINMTGYRTRYGDDVTCAP